MFRRHVDLGAHHVKISTIKRGREAVSVRKRQPGNRTSGNREKPSGNELTRTEEEKATQKSKG